MLVISPISEELSTLIFEDFFMKVLSESEVAVVAGAEHTYWVPASTDCTVFGCTYTEAHWEYMSTTEEVVWGTIGVVCLIGLITVAVVAGINS